MSFVKYNIPVIYADSNIVTNNTNGNLAALNQLTGAFETQTAAVLNSTESGQVKSIQSYIDIVGQGTINVTNGSGTITGNGTNFLDSTAGLGASYWFQFEFYDSSNNLYRTTITSFGSNTSATISRCYNEGDLQNATLTSQGSTYVGVTGTYPYNILRQHSKGINSHAFGNGAYAKASSYNFGGTSSSTGDTSVQIGRFSISSGAQSFATGFVVKATGSQSFAGCSGDNSASPIRPIIAAGAQSFNFSTSLSASQGLNHGANAPQSVIIGGLNHNIPSNSDRCVIVGGNAIKASSGVTDTVYFPKIRVGLGIGGSLSQVNTNQNLIARNSSTGQLEINNGSGILTGNTVDIKVATVGNGFYVKEGVNATMGIITLTGGTAVVSTTKVTASSRIRLTVNGGTLTNVGFPYVNARSAGASFTIKSSNVSDTSDVAWLILEPA